MKTYIFFFAFFMLVMSAFGQIEQFGSRALSGKSIDNNTELKNLTEAIDELNSVARPITLIEATTAKDKLERTQSENYNKNLQFEINSKQKELDKLKEDSTKNQTITREQAKKIAELSSELQKYKDTQKQSEDIKKRYLSLYFKVVQSNYIKIDSVLNARTKNVETALKSLSKIKVSEIMLATDKDKERDSLAEKFFDLKNRLTIDQKTFGEQKKVLANIETDIKDTNITENQLDSLQKTLQEFEKVLNKNSITISEFDKFLKKLTPSNEGNGLFQLGGQPDVLSNFSGSNVLNVVPNIDIIGSYYHRSDRLDLGLSVRLFSGYPNTDSSIHRNAASFWLPEASLFGINTDLQLGFAHTEKKPRVKYAVWRLAPSFLIKNTPERDNTGKYTGNANGVGLVHFKTGIEVAPIKYFVLYGYLNFITPITQVQTFRNFYGTNKSFYPFFDFGFRSPIMVSNKENKNTTINIDVNFIGISGDMKAVYPTNDVIIPSIRLGIVQRFNTGD